MSTLLQDVLAMQRNLSILIYICHRHKHVKESILSIISYPWDLRTENSHELESQNLTYHSARIRNKKTDVKKWRFRYLKDTDGKCLTQAVKCIWKGILTFSSWEQIYPPRSSLDSDIPSPGINVIWVSILHWHRAKISVVPVVC